MYSAIPVESKATLMQIRVFDIALALIIMPVVLVLALVLGPVFLVKQTANPYLALCYSLCRIILGDKSFCGLNDKVDEVGSSVILKPALFSFQELHQTIGCIEMTNRQMIRYHENNLSLKMHITLMLKCITTRCLYKNKGEEKSEFSLFNIKIHNRTLQEAVKEIFSSDGSRCRSVFFVNVNSINLSFKNKHLTRDINCGDLVLADGSGVRLGAKRVNVKLKDNVNGTDLLPYICEALVARGESLFLLGAAPGVAQTAANRLQDQYPGLKIAGVQHGYFKPKENASVIEAINRSGASILLVGFGSPIQEKWINENKHQLKVKTALGVGGLFDFYSGRISRAPIWMREIGMEWIYRLAMEPGKKFERYVIGNPLYLFRLYFSSRLKSKGVA
ncbi:N-acetylglucosaminyldiphosphoundecaprenol N-acetyl-beta-D-mannosaminyltransferase [Thalassocella blandensis]|nr:N-acetylglucosaminyldiphosphoundecaprenol N-acetyl-beta-D-mannosaminyltransferase [Thalassocella blandensis]